MCKFVLTSAESSLLTDVGVSLAAAQIVGFAWIGVFIAANGPLPQGLTVIAVGLMVCLPSLRTAAVEESNVADFASLPGWAVVCFPGKALDAFR